MVKKDRKQFVQIDECASTLLSVTCGVPQGSIVYGAHFKDHTNVIFQDLKMLKLCDLVTTVHD